jgi:hypothetical protein
MLCINFASYFCLWKLRLVDFFYDFIENGLIVHSLLFINLLASFLFFDSRFEALEQFFHRLVFLL